MFSNALWVLGLAVVLAALSLAQWQAGQQRQTFPQGLSKPMSRLAIAAGFILVGLGLTLTVEPWWYKIGWAGLMVVSFWGGLTAWQERFDQSSRS